MVQLFQILFQRTCGRFPSNTIQSFLHCPGLFFHSVKHKKKCSCNSIFPCTNSWNWLIKAKENSNVDISRGKTAQSKKYERVNSRIQDILGSLPLPIFGMCQENKNECEYQVKQKGIRRVKWLLKTPVMFGWSLALGDASNALFR